MVWGRPAAIYAVTIARRRKKWAMINALGAVAQLTLYIFVVLPRCAARSRTPVPENQLTRQFLHFLLKSRLVTCQEHARFCVKLLAIHGIFPENTHCKFSRTFLGLQLNKARIGQHRIDLLFPFSVRFRISVPFFSSAGTEEHAGEAGL